MTYDYDVVMNLPMHLFYTMQIRIMEIQRLVKQLREDMKKWGFDRRTPLKSDSFTIPRLIQFEADLAYILEEMRNVEMERKVKEMAELKPKDCDKAEEEVKEKSEPKRVVSPTYPLKDWPEKCPYCGEPRSNHLKLNPATYSYTCSSCKQEFTYRTPADNHDHESFLCSINYNTNSVGCTHCNTCKYMKELIVEVDHIPGAKLHKGDHFCVCLHPSIQMRTYKNCICKLYKRIGSKEDSEDINISQYM